jgi:hypothetical protein
MSQQLINRSTDLQRLLDDGYDVEIRSNYLLVKDVPYVNSQREIALGTLVSELSLAGDITTAPSSHIIYFTGSYPCNRDGSEIEQIRHQSTHKEIDRDFVVHHSFSSKPPNGYKDYYEKMTTYAAIISSPAQSIDSHFTAKTFWVIESEEGESVFKYLDTASSRVGINMVTKKLEIGKIGIVGLGGTGSYVLDLVAKTPVKEIHLFDGDKFLQHNAFRSPGAPSIDELRKAQPKVAFFQAQYSKMHRHIIAHNYFIGTSNVDKLCEMDFVFLCLDRGGVKKLIVEKLEEFGISFIDVGMGVYQTNGSLGGVLRVTSSFAEQREHIKAKGRIPFSDGDDNNAYTQNIQIADLNALNATLAVIKWKKQFGFYLDLEKEYHSTYTIDGNMLTNDDKL